MSQPDALALAASPNTPSLFQQRRAIYLIFLTLGVDYASWAARIPALRDGLHLNNEELGLSLLMAGIGSLAIFPATKWLLAHHGSRWVTLRFALLTAASLPLMALAPNMLLFMGAMLFFGLMGSAMDVGMNAQAVMIEKQAQRSLMSGFHAFFSLGGLIGAGLGSMASSLDVPTLWHLSGVTLLCCVLIFAVRGDILAPVTDKQNAVSAGQSSVQVFTWPQKSVWLLGTLGMCGFVIEGGVADWGAIYLHDDLHASYALAPWGFGAFSLSMVMGRLKGDGLRDRWGSVPLLRAAGALATTGLVVALLSPYAWAAIVGFFLVGLGMSVVVPILFSAAGHLPGGHGERNLAFVAMFGYSGGLMGPPLLGFVAHHFSLSIALALLAGLAFLITLRAGVAAASPSP